MQWFRLLSLKKTQNIITMRILISLFLLLSLAACQQKENKAPAAATEVAALKSIEISVKGMTCEGCENTVKESVTALAGVTECTASFKEEKAVVKYDSTKTTAKQLEDAIAGVGYEVVGHKDIK
jgi:copper chaperone CopZ